jgi:hypothetical protein
MSYCMDTYVAHVFVCQVTGCRVGLPESLPEHTWASIRGLDPRLVHLQVSPDLQQAQCNYPVRVTRQSSFQPTDTPTPGQ